MLGNEVLPMTEQELKALETACPLVSTLAAAEEAVWVNPERVPFA